MNPIVTPEILNVMKAVHYRPAVSIIMPFEQKMNLKAGLAHSLKFAADKVEKELLENYPGELSILVMQKLRAMIKGLEPEVHKKSIALYVSPVFEKVLYLDMAVEEKIIVDESFEIRDLIYCKKQLHKYLVLLLSGKEYRMYLGNSDSFVRIVPDAPATMAAYQHDSPERVANFSDMSERKEIVMDKFLHHIDSALDTILNSYQLPLFVLGTERILGHFKKLTKHEGAISKYIHGNYEEATFPQLKEMLEPHFAELKLKKQIAILHRLEEAAGKKALAVGITEVWREAMNHKGQLLVVEKNYMVAAQHGSQEDVIYKVAEPATNFSYIKDAVDEVIEIVLENGGDVEFIDENFLGEYQQIALVKYY
ncbi:MAG: hypothetical protein IPQ25_18395 [Chitinophagaceae bacterium]|nr:hypothetical protein [Chitinophagaceae bacterium]